MNNFKTILGIETSCDETAAAVLTNTQGRIQILSNVVGSSALMHEKYGGVIPEQAAREQLKSIIPVIKEAFNEAKLEPKDIDAIALTQGPGLIGSLLVGVETAKTLSLVWNKPLIPVNHLLGHLYANWIDTSLSDIEYRTSENQTDTRLTINDKPKFPCLGLLVSGGHSDIVLFTDHQSYTYLGGTRDDAAGECFDKCARLIGFPYPGGPKISKLAQQGNPKAFNLPRPLASSDDLDFSFSGLKTAFSNLVAEHFEVSQLEPDKAAIYWKHIVLDKDNPTGQEKLLADLCASIEQAIIDSLIKKTIKSAQIHKVEQIIVAGGVAANQKLINDLRSALNDQQLPITLHVPPPILCTDNAAMIAARAFFEKETTDFSTLEANPNLSLQI